jgi:hypothetical protein
LKPTNWKVIAELIGIAAIVGSLIFVGLEIQQSREIARLEWTGVLAAEQIALDSLLASEAEVWRKGCDGSDLSPAEQVVFVRQFSSFHHFAFARWIRGNVGLTGIDAQAPLTDGILGFPEEVDSWIPVLEQEQPNPGVDVSMCGTWAP